MITSYQQLFETIKQRPRRTLVVPSAEGQSIVQACREAKEAGICDSILIGDQVKLAHLLEEEQIPASTFQIIHEPSGERAVDLSLQLIRDGRGNMLMKGKTDTPTLLKAVLDAEKGLRTGRVLSHVAVVEIATYPRLMLWSDGGINIRPDLEKRIDILCNAAGLAHRLGIARPGVALLSAMEKVNPKMEETLDYAKILEMHRQQPLVEAEVEGPLAMDIALDPEAAAIKEVESRIAGRTDIFITPDIATCNVSVKSLIYLAGAKVAGLVVGAAVPVVLLSRADDAGTKLRSIALGALWG